MPTSGLDGLARVPHIALDDDGLDVLDLALIGALPVLPALPGVPADGELVLTDAENTPLAHLRPRGSSGRDVVALRPFAAGVTVRSDPAYRRRPADVQAEVAAVAAGRPVLAVVVDDVPTRDDVGALAAVVERLDPASVLCVALVGRRPRDVGQVGWDGLVRCTVALAETIGAGIGAGIGADGIDSARIDVRPVVVPWPSARAAAAAALDLDAVLRRFGATDRHEIRASRSEAAARRMEALSTVYESAVRDLYPEPNATEVIAAARPAPTRGAVILFTGLSGSGKSTIARALGDALPEHLPNPVTLLDGDDVRRSLSSDLGFDVASREANIDRIGYVASLIAAHGGIAIAAPIAPFVASRARARARAEAVGAFVLVHVSTPLEVCEARDRKGLYARARAGEIADFTGITSPYEAPDDAEVTVDTSTTNVASAVGLVLAALRQRLAASGPSIG